MSTDTTTQDDDRLMCPRCQSITVMNIADFDEALCQLIAGADNIGLEPQDVRTVLDAHRELLTPTLGDADDE